MMQEIVTGTVEGTGAVINISLGFKPKWVRLLNVDGLVTCEWNASMPDASGLITKTAGTLSRILVGGVTPYDGVAGGAGAGFTIGTDVDINQPAETVDYVIGR